MANDVADAEGCVEEADKKEEHSQGCGSRAVNCAAKKQIKEPLESL